MFISSRYRKYFETFTFITDLSPSSSLPPFASELQGDPTTGGDGGLPVIPRQMVTHESCLFFFFCKFETYLFPHIIKIMSPQENSTCE